MTVFDLPDAGVLVTKESFDFLDGFEDYTLGEYTAIAVENAKLIAANVSEITTVEGLTHFEYEFENTEDGKTYHCHTFTYKAGDAFWMAQFMIYKEEDARLYSKFVEWAKNVKFY